MTSNAFNVAAVRDEVFASLRLTQTENGAFFGTWAGNGPLLEKHSPIDGSLLGAVRQPSEKDYQTAVEAASRAFEAWKLLPAPKRGEVVRRIGDRLRAVKSSLGKLVTLEAGKIVAEGEGEVQEMIDICDFANGLSRQLYGLTIASSSA
jgi:aldehyde dehydrogenase (NAD+)